MSKKPQIAESDLGSIEKKFDDSLQIRKLGKYLGLLISLLFIVFAIYHYVTAGMGIPAEHWHMGLHLAGLSIFIFITLPMFKKDSYMEYQPNRWWRYSNVPLWDWIFAILGVFVSLWLGLTWYGLDISLFGFNLSVPEQSMRQGNPTNYDVVFGTILTFLTLEMARRSLGILLPIIISTFVLYALSGPYIGIDILRHPGVTWTQFVNTIYFPSEGIFGISLWIMSTVVFHFVIFGVIAQKIGLGKFFVDVSKIIAGRYVGGPAKVSVVGSAFFGTISGSSIANTVSTGSLTIPNMKRLGYPPHFAGAVEAAASSGGQITPPIMGAATFVMAEFLEIPYTTIVIAAIIPALMHYFGVFSIIHLMSCRLGLKGYARSAIPQFMKVLKEGWYTIIPLVVLMAILFSGYTPYMAAFAGITACIVVGLLPKKENNLTVKEILHALEQGARYAIAVSAAGAAIGIVIGVINSTGLAFRLGFLVTNSTIGMAESLYSMFSVLPFELFEQNGIQLFLSLILIAMTCILMGAGLPTTALYIMLATVAQPALAQLGVPPLASHLFVLYYGVISEITPPVCTSAYAAAGIARANPLRTGFTAFSLGIGKLIVPLVFVYSPAMLLVLPEHFTLFGAIKVTIATMLAIICFSMAITKYCFGIMNVIPRVILLTASIAFIVPSINSFIFGFVILCAVVAYQYKISQRN